MTAELLAVGLLAFVHVLGAAVLIWALLGDEQPFRMRPPGGRGGGDDPPRPTPSPTGDSGLPLAVTTPAAVRLRDHGARLADAHPRPRRRRDREPAEPARSG